MRVNTQKFKSNTILPTFNDGGFEIFEVKQTDDPYPLEYIKSTKKVMAFSLLSISDKVLFEFESRNLRVTYKLRIPRTPELGSSHVVKLGNTYHKIFNAYHHTTKDGFKMTDLTLLRYDAREIKEDEND